MEGEGRREGGGEGAKNGGREGGRRGGGEERREGGREAGRGQGREELEEEAAAGGRAASRCPATVPPGGRVPLGRPVFALEGCLDCFASRPGLPCQVSRNVPMGCGWGGGWSGARGQHVRRMGW